MVLSTSPSDKFIFSDQILSRAVIVNELLAIKYDEDLVLAFIERNRYFQDHFSLFFQEISFWKQAFRFLSKIDFSTLVIELSEFIDFFIYKIHSGTGSYNLKGRTPKSVEHAILKWHEEANYKRSYALIKSEWDSPKTFDIIKPHGTFRIEKVNCGSRLLDESKALRHCAFSYIQDCVSGFTEIWSVKKKVNNKWLHYLTIQVSRGRIVQISGLRNCEPNLNDRAVIDEWFKDYYTHMKW
jgi:hypothetical protein